MGFFQKPSRISCSNTLQTNHFFQPPKESSGRVLPRWRWSDPHSRTGRNSDFGCWNSKFDKKSPKWPILNNIYVYKKLVYTYIYIIFIHAFDITNVPPRANGTPCCFLFRKLPFFWFNSKIRGPFEVNLHGPKAVNSTPFSSAQIFWVSETLPCFQPKVIIQGLWAAFEALFLWAASFQPLPFTTE